jgi:hypothetical protein
MPGPRKVTVPHLKPLVGQPINSNVGWAACKNNQALPHSRAANDRRARHPAVDTQSTPSRGRWNLQIMDPGWGGTKYNETFELFSGKYEALGIYPGWHFQVAHY